jgi:opacity protein-like surface antigen
MRSGLRLGALLCACVGWSAGASAQDFTLRLFGGLASGEVENEVRFVEPMPPVGVFPIAIPQVIEHDDGLVGGAAAGVELRRLTLEGELAFRPAERRAGTAFISDSLIVSGMANGWYNAPLTDSLIAYGGGGVGVAEDTEIDSDLKFAWQVGGGLRHRLSEKITLGVGYRYFRIPDMIDFTGVDGFLGPFSVSGDYSESSILAEIGYTF